MLLVVSLEEESLVQPIILWVSELGFEVLLVELSDVLGVRDLEDL